MATIPHLANANAVDNNNWSHGRHNYHERPYNAYSHTPFDVNIDRNHILPRSTEADNAQ